MSRGGDLNDLTVEVAANTKGLDRGLRNASRRQSRYVRETERQFGRLDRLQMFAAGRFGAPTAGGLARFAHGRARAGAGGGGALAGGLAGGAAAGGLIGTVLGVTALREMKRTGSEYERLSEVQRRYWNTNEKAFGEFSRRAVTGIRMIQSQLSREGFLGNVQAAGLAFLVGDDTRPFRRRAIGALLRPLTGDTLGDVTGRFEQFRRQQFRRRAQTHMISGAVRRGQPGEAAAIAGAIRGQFARETMTPAGGAAQMMRDAMAFGFRQLQDRGAAVTTQQIE